MNPWIKLLIEAGPLAAFFAAYSMYGIMAATAVFMVAIVIAVVAAFVLERRVPVLPLFSAVIVLVFGGLTLYLDNATFIYMKPTIINGLFGLALLVGLATGRGLMRYVFSSVFQLDDQGWKALSLRWGVFFIAVAVLNELVWRNFAEETWVNFKVFGVLPLTLVFAMAQARLIERHSLEASAE